jgi:hypothetical protein
VFDLASRRKIYEEWITEDVKKKIPQWKKQGDTDEQIYKRIGVSRNIMIRWKKTYPEFAKLFEKGREELVLELRDSMFKRGLGYTKKLKEYKLDKEGKIDPASVKVKEIYIHSDQCLFKSLAWLDKPNFGDILNEQKILAEIDLIKSRINSLRNEDGENVLSTALDNIVNLVKRSKNLGDEKND